MPTRKQASPSLNYSVRFRVKLDSKNREAK